jgi:hypothetical protein
LSRFTQLKAGALGILLLILVAIPATAQDAPLARITVPMRGQTVRGNVTVQGTATSPQFARYEIAYAPEPDMANWTVINGALQPVANGLLAVWNTRPVPDGQYALRIQVFNADSSVTETLVREITLANAAATSAAGAAIGVTQTTTTTAGTITDAGDAGENEQSLDLASIPRAFVKGATYALYAFALLGAYLVLKRLIGFALRKVIKRRVDYGR